MRQMFLDGQRHWPRVRLEFEQFALHCSRVLGDERDDMQRDAADLFLCCACAALEPEALLAFESEVLGAAKAAILRVNHNAEFLQETLQEVRQRLLTGPEARVNQYSGRGPLKAWVRVAATRVALDGIRGRGLVAAREVELSESLEAAEQSPEELFTKKRYGHVFQEALRDAVSALTAQERNVLRMHVAGRCSIDEIGRAYNVHRATAARWIDRSKTRIYESVQRKLGNQHAKLTTSEFRSLARLMGGELELNLTAASTSSQVTSRRSDG